MDNVVKNGEKNQKTDCYGKLVDIYMYFTQHEDGVIIGYKNNTSNYCMEETLELEIQNLKIELSGDCVMNMNENIASIDVIVKGHENKLINLVKVDEGLECGIKGGLKYRTNCVPQF